MRRIIERIVTVVTTTTWKISWEADPPQPVVPLRTSPAGESVSLPPSDPETQQSTSPRPTDEINEVNVTVRDDPNKTNGG